MTVVLALLREDHIIFASDSRHVRGTNDGRYRNDQAWKVEPILDNRGLIGFAGHDRVEDVIASARRRGVFNGQSLPSVADGIGQIIRESYGTDFRSQDLDMVFLLAGFEKESGHSIARTLVYYNPDTSPLPRSYVPEGDNYEIIGYRCHGAFYAMRKCAKDCGTVDAGVRLACFTLSEIGKYEIRVGGNPQIYVIHRDGEIEDLSGKLQECIAWADGVGEQIRQLIVSPVKPQSSE